jgi:hypothetical protein
LSRDKLAAVAASTGADAHSMELLWFGLVVVGTLAACAGFGAFIGRRL